MTVEREPAIENNCCRNGSMPNEKNLNSFGNEALATALSVRMVSCG